MLLVVLFGLVEWLLWFLVVFVYFVGVGVWFEYVLVFVCCGFGNCKGF